MLNSLGSNTAKLNGMKMNISIRVKGFGWEWCRHPWAKNGRKFSVSELAKHLRWIITNENNNKKIQIPSEPPVNLPKRKYVGALGTDIDFIRDLDEKYLAQEGGFKKKAGQMRQQKESSGGASLYLKMQPYKRPSLEDLIGRRI